MISRRSLTLALSLCAAPGAVLWAQPPAPTPATTKAATASTSADRLSAAAARSITRLALIDLRLRESPELGDARVCSALLALAMADDPNNADLVRTANWVIDLAEDEEASRTIIRRLVELDPRDTFAQFRLISSRLQAIQNADERLVGYERFLGPQGASLDPTIRSKLALEAGTLLQERGDDQGAVAKLKLATTLDPTNKDAAIAAFKFYRAKLTDPAGKADLLVNVLMADPVDFSTHEALARTMASGGAFEPARRFQTTAANIRERAGVEQDSSGVIESLCVDWPLDGPEGVVSELNKALAVRRNDQRKMIEFMEESLVPTAGVAPPEEVHLDPQLDRLRILAAVAAHDTATVESATADFRATYDVAVKYLSDLPPNVAVDIDDPKGEARALRLERAIVLSWADVAGEFADKEVEEVAASEGQAQDEPALLEAHAWRLARSSEPLKAVELFRPLSADSGSARVGLATALERGARVDEALTEYRAIMRDLPMTPEAAWSWHRAKEILGRKDADPELAKRLRAIGAGVPVWVDNATKDPARLMSLATELVETSLDPAEPAALRVRLTNVSEVPLGVGPGRTVDSRLLLSPTLEVGLEAMREGVSPELLDAERRIRLMPRESIEIICWPDPGLSGWLAESLAVDAVRTRWRIIQGFTRGAQGQIIPGPTCLSAGSKSLVRPAMTETALAPAELAAKIAAAPEADLDRLVIASRALLLAHTPEPRPAKAPGGATPPAATPPAAPRLSEEDAAKLANAFAVRYPSCSPLARRLLIAGLPHAGQTPAMKVLDDAARADTDPACAALYLVSRVTSADDEALKRALQSPDPRLSSTAKVIQERIESDAPLYGKLGPGFTGLRQASAKPGDDALPDKPAPPVLPPDTPAPAAPEAPR